MVLSPALNCSKGWLDDQWMNLWCSVFNWFRLLIRDYLKWLISPKANSGLIHCNWLIDWLIDLLIDWLIVWLFVWLMKGGCERSTGRLVSRLKCHRAAHRIHARTKNPDLLVKTLQAHRPSPLQSKLVRTNGCLTKLEDGHRSFDSVARRQFRCSCQLLLHANGYF